MNQAIALQQDRNANETHLEMQHILVDIHQTVSDLGHAEDLNLVQHRANALVLVNIIGRTVSAPMRQVEKSKQK